MSTLAPTGAPAPSYTPPKTSHVRRNLGITAAVVVVLLGIGAALWFILSGINNGGPSTTNTQAIGGSTVQTHGNTAPNLPATSDHQSWANRLGQKYATCNASQVDLFTPNAQADLPPNGDATDAASYYAGHCSTVASFDHVTLIQGDPTATDSRLPVIFAFSTSGEITRMHGVITLSGKVWLISQIAPTS